MKRLAMLWAADGGDLDRPIDVSYLVISLGLRAYLGDGGTERAPPSD